MAVTIDGNSLVFTGTLTVTNFTNPANGVCTLILTPDGGVGTLPALLAGDPGLPPTLTVGTVTTLSAGASATFALSETSAGGAGVASAYTVNVGIPQGQKGDTGTNSTLAGCTDLTGTAAVDDIPMVTGTGPTEFTLTPFPWAFVAGATSFTSISTTGSSTQTICIVSIAAKSFSYIPLCFAEAIVAGTTNTLLNLSAWNGPPGTGTELAVTDGVIGTQYITMNPWNASALSNAVVAANTAVQIYFVVRQINSTADTWGVANTTPAFTVVGLPVST